jgi:hypothetical protein
VVQAAVQASSDPQAPVVTPTQTVANISAQIVQRADQKTSRFDVQLTPDGLGRVDVAVEIDAQGKVTAALSFEKADSAALVKSNSSDLQAALAAAGLNLAAADLKISHVADSSGSQASAVSQQIVAPSTPSSDANGAGGQGGSPQGQAQHFAAGGQSFSQGQQGQGQSDRPQTPAFGGARSFEAAVSAADGVDRQAAYRAGVNTRGLDIRI